MSQYEGRSRQGENMLRTIHFDHPEWTPVLAGFLPACWVKYGSALDDVLLAHPRLFPSHKKPERREPPVMEGLMAAGRLHDCWGCTWENLHPGIIGQVVGHPLADWNAFATWKRPHPAKRTRISDRAIGKQSPKTSPIKKNAAVYLPDFSLPHGFHYLLLCDLRGFQNMMMDMITDEPMLHKLLEVIIDYNTTLTRK